MHCVHIGQKLSGKEDNFHQISFYFVRLGIGICYNFVLLEFYTFFNSIYTVDLFFIESTQYCLLLIRKQLFPHSNKVKNYTYCKFLILVAIFMGQRIVGTK